MPRARRARIPVQDQWHTELGDPLPTFMANEMRDNHFVFVICTPNYRTKSEEGRGGVGCEGSVMIAKVAASGNHGEAKGCRLIEGMRCREQGGGFVG